MYSLTLPPQPQQALEGVPTLPEVVSVPNVITLAGYAATIAWLLGAPWYWAIASILADELDGYTARALNQTSELGSNLDWATDLTLTGLVANRINALWLVPGVTFGQAYLRTSDFRPSFGSPRALMTLYALYTERSKKKK